MKRFVLAAAMMLLMAVTATAQEHLEPESSTLSGESVYLGTYYDPAIEVLVTAIFHDAYKDDVIVRMLGFPWSMPQYVVGLRGPLSQPRIFVLETDYPKSPSLNARLKACDADITPARTGRIANLWEKMLLGTRYFPQSDSIESLHGTDGAEYHFSGAGIRMRHMSGVTRAEDRGSNAAILVGIGETLRGICQESRTLDFAKLDELIAQLERKLP